MPSAPLSRSRHWLPILGLLALLASAPLARTLWNTATPETHDGKTVMLINGKKRTYWKARKDVEQVLQVTGPSTVRMISRVPWSTKYTGKSYTINWTLDDGQTGAFTQEIRKASGSVRQSDNKKLSRGRTNELEIPAGLHQLRLTLSDTPGTVAYFRFHTRPLEPLIKISNVDLKPLESPTPRKVQAGKSTVDYYPLPSGSEMSVEMEGPGFLKVISRLDWDQTMTSTQKYTLKVFEDGLLKQSYVLKGRRSETSTYVGKDDSVPARGEVVYLEVPAGRHRYTVRFQESGREVNLRFLAPSPADETKKNSKGKG